ncbi:cardiolipin synthase [Pseudoclavibacter sp. CFCC 14310]|uniref:cardiolipin synthase n=1 Tax=Pseudoclavibacter sp. CFCC 14310 TaxID=2615180 RepID=UPI001CE3C2FB|nr:cardiolipin synthase [Pseudoclavibacter sp. CFCC 14310]
MEFPTVLTWVLGILIVIDLALRLVALFIVPRNRTPASGTAWLMTVTFFPLIGFLLFLAIGTNHLPKQRREKQREAALRINGKSPTLHVETALGNAPDWFVEVIDLNQRLGGMPLVGGNQVHIMHETLESYDAMIAEIDRAQQRVHVQFYILAYDETTAPFFAALRRAVQRGVTVRILIDYWASRRTRGFAQTRRELDAIGATWAYTLPFKPMRGHMQRPDLRNHRKIVTVDGEVGFTGSLNLVHPSYHKPKAIRRGMRWIDLMARFEGPVVAELDAVFATDWFIEVGEEVIEESLQRRFARNVHELRGPVQCQVVPSGPGYASESNLQMFLALLYHARHSVEIVSPYFVPNDAMLYAMANIRARGINVDLYVSEMADQFLVHHAQCSYYEQLLQMGVRIWRYRAPALLHTKYVIVDDQVSALGSSNMDMRSFTLNMEVTVLLYGEATANVLGDIARLYRSSSVQLTLGEWSTRPWYKRMADNICRLTSALQ